MDNRCPLFDEFNAGLRQQCTVLSRSRAIGCRTDAAGARGLEGLVARQLMLVVELEQLQLQQQASGRRCHSG